MASSNASPRRPDPQEPSLILADVTTSALDHVNADLVMDILAEQAAHGALVLISTHSDHIARLCDRAISLDSTDNETEVLSASIHRAA